MTTTYRAVGNHASDAVVDLDRVLADPADPQRLRTAYDSGDRLHPNDAGTRAIAAAIDLTLRRTR